MAIAGEKTDNTIRKIWFFITTLPCNLPILYGFMCYGNRRIVSLGVERFGLFIANRFAIKMIDVVDPI